MIVVLYIPTHKDSLLKGWMNSTPQYREVMDPDRHMLKAKKAITYPNFLENHPRTDVSSDRI